MNLLMPRKPDDPEQSARFIAFAKEHGADTEAESFERGFKTLAPLKRPQDAAAKPMRRARRKKRARPS